jgi:hypothetical protein
LNPSLLAFSNEVSVNFAIPGTSLCKKLFRQDKLRLPGSKKYLVLGYSFTAKQKHFRDE